MRVKCDNSLFDNITAIDSFIDCMSAHRESHVMDLSNVKELVDSISNDHSLTQRIKALAVLSANQNFYYSLNVKDKNDENGISIDLLNRFLSRKAIVIIENEHSDARFLDVVIEAIGNARLKKTKNISWEVKGAGGCGEIPKTINSECEKFEKSPFRVVVIHDSDKLSIANELSVTQKNIISKSREFSIECMTLEKREIENYIPYDLIETLGHGYAKRVEFFKLLTSQQMDFFDYKNGFKRKNKNDKDFNGLFNDLNDDVFNGIKDGFGDDIAEKVFSRGLSITIEDFNKRCYKIIPEFKAFCEAIERVL